jgi:hypothetical protein
MVLFTINCKLFLGIKTIIHYLPLWFEQAKLAFVFPFEIDTLLLQT